MIAGHRRLLVAGLGPFFAGWALWGSGDTSAYASGVASVAHLSGRVAVDVGRGLLSGDVCLGGLPPRASHAFLLNKGLNIRRIATPEGERLSYLGEHELAGGALVGEGLLYRVPASRQGRALEGFCVAYTGAFPVYRRDEERGFDFKGVIAFTDGTLRAPEQAKWYPVPFDDSTSIATYEVTYELEVKCADCTALYLNGAEPVVGSHAVFLSLSPTEPVLFTGTFDFVRGGGLWFVNGSVGPEAGRAYEAEVERIARLYEWIAGAPLEEPPVLLGFDRLSSASGFSFATWPTIGLGDVRDFDAVLKDDTGGPGLGLPAELAKTLSHEMGHHYFGTGREEGPLAWFFGEAIPEWASLIHVRESRGEDPFREMVRAHVRRVRERRAVVPLSRIEAPEQTDEVYRYSYGSLLLLELERRFGPDTVRGIVRSLLANGPGRGWNYDLFVTAAGEAGIEPQDWARFEAACLGEEPTRGCVAAYESRP